MKTLILGSGFTGMAAAIKTGAAVYEQSNHAGGICTDYVKDGFRFSNGGPHYLFGKDKGLEYIKSLVEVKEYERKAGVYYNHTFPYPIQSNFLYAPPLPTDFSFKNSMRNKFGEDLCGMFFWPFNEKYTAGLYNEILPQDNYKTPSHGSTGWISTFCDPVNGLSDLVGKMSSQCDIKYNKKAVEIHKNFVLFDDGTGEDFDTLISTIPLNKMMEICGEKVSLPYTSVLVINIGAEPGINLPREHWLYIPFCKSGCHRVAFYTNVDKSKAPHGQVGLSVEIAFQTQWAKGSDFKDVISKKVIEELQSWNWIGEVNAVSIDWVECAYTWQYNKEDVPNAIQWLKERNITSTGRYGKWKFQGLSQSIEDGFNI